MIVDYSCIVLNGAFLKLGEYGGKMLVSLCGSVVIIVMVN